VALAQFQRLGDKKSSGVERGKKRHFKRLHQFVAASHEPALQQCRLYRDVFCGLGQAGGQCAHTGANFKAAIPATANEGFDAAFQFGVEIGVESIRHQHQHIHVGKWKQLTAAVSTHGQQGQR